MAVVVAVAVTAMRWIDLGALATCAHHSGRR